MDLHQKIISDPVLSQKYEVIEKLGQGCFGKIYKVKNKLLKLHTALKLEISLKNSKKSMLENQAELLKTLKGKSLVPQFHAFGQWKMGNYIEIELLNKDLNSLVQKVFSPQEIDTLTAKLINSLSVLHNSNIIHQDIKPQNIMINQKGEYVFIDFGISKRLINCLNQRQLSRRRGRGFIGTPRYASIAAHEGMQQSKKDDLQSLMYNIGYLYFKRLPWLSLKVSGSVKINEIKVTKIRTAEGVFQQMGKSYSSAFSYIKSLQHMQEPNYKFLIGLFKRNQSMIIDTFRQSTVKGMNENEGVKRKAEKKFSLNNGQNNGECLHLQLKGKELGNDFTFGCQRLVKDSNNSRSEMGSSKGVSMRAYNGVDEVTDVGELGSFEESVKMSDVDDKQPTMPNISKFFSPLSIKNPFFNNR